MRGENEEAKRLLDAIAAVPRGTGTPEERHAREYCAAFLRANGFSTREEDFGYSAFAGTVATPLAGAVLVSLFSWSWMFGWGRGEGGGVGAILVIHVVLLVAVGLLATRASVLHLPLLRRTGVNLVARSSGESTSGEARLWLIAHLDSKSQPVSILARAAGVICCAIVFAATILMMAAQYLLNARLPAVLWYAVGVLGILASVPLLMSVVTNQSRGALDNASGVVAVLLAAAALSRQGLSDVGVLITSAEELGLAGAHAWSAVRSPGLAINCDSVDDNGAFLCLSGGSAAGSGGRRNEGIVQRELREAAGASETPFYERRRLMGILVDSMALEARGWDTVTLSRGTLASLGRIHTAADTPASCTGLGSAAAAILIRDASSALLVRV